jgi:hypothetical protein
MRPKSSLDRLLTLKVSGVHDQMGSIAVESAEEIPGERWDARSRPVTSFLSLRYLQQSFKLAVDILDRDAMIFVILCSNCEWFSNQCLERIWAKLFDLSQSLSASVPA